MMNPIEKAAILSLKQEFIESVEPMTLVSSLYKSDYVKKSFYKTVQLLFRNGNKREEIICYVIDSFPFQVGFPSLVITLDKCRYYKLAARLFLKLFEFSSDFRIHNSESASRAKQLFFRNLKRMVHDSQFKNPRKALRYMAVRCKADLDNETDEYKRQLLADRCVAIIGVEIDAFYDSLACENEITQKEMFSEMRKLIPHTSNPLITDTVYYTRQANMNAFHGNIQHAEDMLIQARTSAFTIQHCLELVNMLYVEVYVKLWEFEINPSKSVLDSIMMWGRIGLESLEAESEATKLLWRRMFILRMVFALLGIGNRANIIPQYIVDPVSLQEAQTLLAVIDTNWNDIEVRREMFYCVARARLNEQIGRFEEAKHYIDRAKRLAVQGRFLEKIPFIDEFATMIDSRIGTSSIDSSNTAEVINMTSLPRPGSPASVAGNSQTQVKCPDLNKGLRYSLTSKKDSSSKICHNMQEIKTTECSETFSRCTNIECRECRSVPRLETFKCIEESSLFQKEHVGQLGAINLYQATEFSNSGREYRSSNGDDDLKIQTLKCCDSVSSYNSYLERDKNCYKCGYNPHVRDKDNAIELIEAPTKQQGVEARLIEELKLSGGNLVLTSVKEVTTECSQTLSSFLKYSITEAKVEGRSIDSFSHLQSVHSDDTEPTQRRISMRHLLHQCHEGVDFGSVALFEDRSEGEGASHTQLQTVLSDNTQVLPAKTGLSTDDARDISRFDEEQFCCDIDDEALFGDG
ncbi:uncharacterized protein LOC123545207 [Mercenaria mercenaria]|uniref:uncharacterized protein LOC123545207 n=1 Tax=Mercenaria mercenaria TaxID=6596 RepID=UPI00234E8B7F|nr:uncharacterized protein LOC123545207 [Mercenaria mercenaria]